MSKKGRAKAAGNQSITDSQNAPIAETATPSKDTKPSVEATPSPPTTPQEEPIDPWARLPPLPDTLKPYLSYILNWGQAIEMRVKKGEEDTQKLLNAIVAVDRKLDEFAQKGMTAQQILAPGQPGQVPDMATIAPLLQGLGVGGGEDEFTKALKDAWMKEGLASMTLTAKIGQTVLNAVSSKLAAEVVQKAIT